MGSVLLRQFYNSPDKIKKLKFTQKNLKSKACNKWCMIAMTTNQFPVSCNGSIFT